MDDPNSIITTTHNNNSTKGRELMRIRNREVDVVYGIGISIIALFVLGVIGVIIARIAHEISLPDDAHQYRNCKILQNSKYVKCSDLNEYAKTFDRTKIANTLFKENDGKPYLEIEYCGNQQPFVLMN